MHIHFIGIGGIGISGLAQFCEARGDFVSGSEIQETGILPKLRQKNITVSIPQKPENIPEKCDLVVYTEAIIFTGTKNAELAEAHKRNIPTKTYFEYLGEISRDFFCIAVTGTHGKTTTTGLLTSALLEAKIDPTIFVGSKLRELSGGNFRLGNMDQSVPLVKGGFRGISLKGHLMLLEACEYRENFRFIHPDIVLLTNAEIDHVDYYKSQAHYYQAMVDFCAKAKLVIYHDNDPDAQKIIQKIAAENQERSKKITTIAVTQDERDAMTEISLSGDHNRANAALVQKLGEIFSQDLKSPVAKGSLLASKHSLKGFSLGDFLAGLHQYQGAWRRQEFLGEKIIEGKKIRVFDDYGHHPTEIVATIQSLREEFPSQKIGLIFEPHQYSRTRVFFTQFLEAFASADFVAMHPIYAARDTDEDKAAIGIRDFQKKNPNIAQVTNLAESQHFAKSLDEGDILLFMGAGVIDQLAEKFME
jgi:UDP-N-acetylmuramate--alanine ligase